MSAMSPLVRAEAIRIVLAEHRDPRLNVGVIASRLHISVRNLQRHFATVGGVWNLITRTRLDSAAAALCAQPDATIEHIAIACGFADVNAFRVQFKRRFGENPSSYRRRALAEAQTA